MSCISQQAKREFEDSIRGDHFPTKIGFTHNPLTHATTNRPKPNQITTLPNLCFANKKPNHICH